jgi:PAS domain S-box-containing protein
MQRTISNPEPSFESRGLSSGAWRFYWRQDAALAVALGLVYYALARLGILFQAEPENIALFWPAAGISAGAMIAAGRRLRPYLACSEFVAVLVVNLRTGTDIGPAIMFAVLNTTESLIVAACAERLMGPRREFDRLTHALGFIGAALIGPAITAIGVALVFPIYDADASRLALWRIWVEADVIGILTFAPLVIALPSLLRDRPPPPVVAEGVLLLLVLAGASAYMYIGLEANSGPFRMLPLSTLLFPLILWTAARTPLAFATAGIGVVALVIVYCVVNGLGRYGDPAFPLPDRIVAAQLAMLTISIVTLAIATLFGERKRAEASLREANAQLSALSTTLEQRVLERTRDLSFANRELTRQAVERERVTSELRQSEAWLHSAQRVAGVGSFSLGRQPSGRQHWSEEARRIIGIDGGMPPGSIAEFAERVVHPADRGRVRLALDEALAAQQVTSIEYRILRSDGEERTVRTEIEPSGPPGNALLLCTALDVTERNATEQKLAEYRSELLHVVRVATAGELATVMAHEVNQPLAAISHTASALVRLQAAGRLAPEDLDKHLKEIASQAHRASAIIGRIRQFVRKRLTAAHPLDLAKVIDDVMGMLAPLAQRHGVRVAAIVPPNLPKIVGDEVQVGQLFVNVVRNAIDAVAQAPDADRLVEISAHLAEDGIVVDVLDHGPGISEAVRARMLEPFFTTKDEGLGMGLPISKTIAEAHGARLAIESCRDHPGTRIRVTFPIGGAKGVES